MPASSVGAMNDGRRRRKAKQARRDVRRMQTRDQETPPEQVTPDETPLIDEVRQALATGHPLDLLGMVSLLIEATKPDPLASLKSGPQPERVNLDDLITGFVGVPIPETTALLAVLAELLIDDTDLALRCRAEVAARHDAPPKWITDLPRVDVYRVVRMTHVLGDGDELLIGARLAGGHELTCAVHVNHLMLSVVKDAFFVPAPIEHVIAVAAEQNTDPDTNFVDMSGADARAWIQHGLGLPPIFTVGSDTWPGCRPLVQWLTGHLPEGGHRHRSPTWDSEPTDEEWRDQFLASPAGAPFGDPDYRGLLLEILDTGTGDPLRWSAARVEQALDSGAYSGHDSGHLMLAVPELLRAYVPFAHAQSGIRDELTAEALAVIDELGPGFKQEVLDNPKYWDDDEDD
jgi:hypothetical protein